MQDDQGAYGVSRNDDSTEEAYNDSGTDVSLRSDPPDVNNASQTGAYPTEMSDSTFGRQDAVRTGQDASTMYVQDLAGLPINENTQDDSGQ